MRFEFGDIRVDVSARRVWRGSEEVHLTRKAFELLILLFEQRPNVVSTEQIHSRLWPGTFVSESSLQRLVSELRKAFGDDSHYQATVRTVHGVGYAFNAQASEIRGTGNEVRAWLVADGWKIPLREGDNVLGREGDDVTKIDAATISRRHARIHLSDEIWIEDLGSKNGTWVRDEPVTRRAPLSEGDSVRFGSLLFTFRLSRGVDSTDTLTDAMRV